MGGAPGLQVPSAVVQGGVESAGQAPPEFQCRTTRPLAATLGPHLACQRGLGESHAQVQDLHRPALRAAVLGPDQPLPDMPERSLQPSCDERTTCRALDCISPPPASIPRSCPTAGWESVMHETPSCNAPSVRAILTFVATCVYRRGDSERHSEVVISGTVRHLGLASTTATLMSRTEKRSRASLVAQLP